MRTRADPRDAGGGNWFYERRKALCKQCADVRSQPLFHESEAALCEGVFLFVKDTRAAVFHRRQRRPCWQAGLYSWKQCTMCTLFTNWLWMLVSAKQKRLSTAGPVCLVCGVKPSGLTSIFCIIHMKRNNEPRSFVCVCVWRWIFGLCLKVSKVEIMRVRSFQSIINIPLWLVSKLIVWHNMRLFFYFLFFRRNIWDQETETQLRTPSDVVTVYSTAISESTQNPLHIQPRTRAFIVQSCVSPGTIPAHAGHSSEGKLVLGTSVCYISYTLKRW